MRSLGFARSRSEAAGGKSRQKLALSSQGTRIGAAWRGRKLLSNNCFAPAEHSIKIMPLPPPLPPRLSKGQMESLDFTPPDNPRAPHPIGGCPRRLSGEPGCPPPPRSNKDCAPAVSLEGGTSAPTVAGEVSVEALWGTREPTAPGMESPPPPPATPAWGEPAMEPGHLSPPGSNEARRLPLLERGQRNPPKIQGWNKTQSRLRPKVIGCTRQDNHKLGGNTESVGGRLDCVPQNDMWKSQLQDVRMGPGLEIGSLQV